MTPCREYAGTLNSGGYGVRQERATIERLGTQLVHRQVMVLAGHDLTGKQVNHHCDNRACFRYDHLYIGTQRENIQDMIRRGRRGDRRPLGERHHNATVSDRDVAIICASDEKASVLASRYGVSAVTIRNYRQGKTRKEAMKVIDQMETETNRQGSEG